ncbi:serine hydrolase [Qipengyuania oceanensis]|uniref:Beta-lactamase n=1 Tax=Qipengyuania oceanensis TaxID=1463597 RepID=A0A844YFX0_9SPHN|nr:serine hydrolase [Qipengyuania oceanensis]MXO62842.1 serine hydrolase [Qipengyuania oceanensis]
MGRGLISGAIGALALALGGAPAALAQTTSLEAQFDRTLGTEVRAPQSFNAVYDSSLERRVAMVADGDRGRIGVYAIDLTTGREVGILADQRFPMASTSKVAIAAAYLAGVDKGRWTLSSEWRLPRAGGTYMPAHQHLKLMIAKSCNDCTDALLEAVGGPAAVNRWMKEAGIEDFQLNRYISSLVREDGAIDPASSIDLKDSATPRAMGQLLAGIYQGKWLSASSRRVLLDAMEQTTTGKKRMPAALPMSANLAHKTGTLSRTASDIGIFYTPDGRAIAAAIYVTGQSPSMAAENSDRGVKLSARANRDMRIASITRALYDGYASQPEQRWTGANYGGN